MSVLRPHLGDMVVLADEPPTELQRVGEVTGTSTTGRRHVTWEDGLNGWVGWSELLVIGHEDGAEWEYWDD